MNPSSVISSSHGIDIRGLWRVDYQVAWDAMRAFTEARDGATRDEIWLVEHPPVYTQGIAGKPEHLLRATAIPVVKTDRGGQITYHAPGQIILYTLIDLRRNKLGVRDMVRRLENSVVAWLANYSVEAHGKVEAPGVYVTMTDGVETKIASLGLKIRKGCSYHGVSVNVEMDLSPFLDIDPCGYPGLRMTRLKDLIPAEKMPSLEEAGIALASLLASKLKPSG